MRTLRYSRLGIAEGKCASQDCRQKFVRAFSKCKSCKGRVAEEEQKMFTSQKCFLPVGISVASSSPEGLNESYIITTKELTHGIADEAPPATIWGAFP
jgi:hypothetical protein